MLQSRRLLAFSSRVHTYTVLLYVFFFIVYILGGYVQVEPNFVSLLHYCLTVVSWTSLLFGFWLLIFSAIVFAGSGLFPATEAILTVLRMAAIYALGLIVSILESLFVHGVTIG
ncbi:MAG: hypothetical protein M0Q37_03250 [Sphaerochaeta sp.]|nr:hypothetical protein [Sphaerochaeta sp.]